MKVRRNLNMSVRRKKVKKTMLGTKRLIDCPKLLSKGVLQ